MSHHRERDMRRTVCKTCIGCLGAGAAGAIGFPVISFMGFPQRLSSQKPLELALDQLPTGQAQYAQLRGRSIVIVMTGDGPLVLSASCTHLGCSVIWDAAQTVFHCPCHGAVFGGGGEVVSGPVNAPLEQIPFEIVEGRIIIA